MNDSANHDLAPTMSDGRNCLEQIEVEKILCSETSDEQLEAAASGPVVTLTLSVVLFACQFCPSDNER